MGLWFVGDNNEVVRSTKGPWVCGIGFIIKKNCLLRTLIQGLKCISEAMVSKRVLTLAKALLLNPCVY